MSDREPLVATKTTLRQARGYLVGIVVGLLFMGGAVVRVDQAADDARDAAGDVHREVQRSEDERCKVTLLSREGSLDKDIRIWTRFGHELGATQERIDEFIEGIRADYEALPVPADCQDQDKETETP